MSGTNKIAGTWALIESLPLIAWTPRWTGTPVGTFTVEVSNEYSPNPDVNAAAGAGNTPLDLAVATATISASPAGAYPAAGCTVTLGPIGFKWARLCYTNTSSSGVLTARAHTKGY